MAKKLHPALDTIRADAELILRELESHAAACPGSRNLSLAVVKAKDMLSYLRRVVEAKQQEEM
jgi:hypothetical protein